jgi:signal peptidase II
MACSRRVGWWMWHSHRKSLAIGLGLVVGGAVGNLIDRLAYGAVADFFHFYAFGYDWYVFNVADIAITFGVIALLYDALIKPEARAGQSS